MTNWSHHKETHILKISTRRRTIEGLFKNTKSKEFHLESSPVKYLYKLEKLRKEILLWWRLFVSEQLNGKRQ